MRFLALSIVLAILSLPAKAEEWKIMTRDVFAFPIECPDGEYSISAVRIVEVEGTSITLRPDAICVKEGHVYHEYGFIAPDGLIHFPFPAGEKMDDFVLEFLTQ